MLNTGQETKVLGGREYIVIENGILSAPLYDMFSNYLNFEHTKLSIYT